MKGKIYEIIILIDNHVDNADSPYCYADSYRAATNIAQIWIEQGYSVVIRAATEEDDIHE